LAQFQGELIIIIFQGGEGKIMLLSSDLKDRIDKFILMTNFRDLYQGYDWGKDRWNQGFSDILKLELALTKAATNNLLNKSYLILIAEWGGLRNPGRVECPQNFRFLEGMDSLSSKQNIGNILNMVRNIRLNVKGFGPTYLSKLIRFAFPLSAGAIDTRVVRCFGNGDGESKKYGWLGLAVRNGGYGWYIPSNQTGWPGEYGKWVAILNYIAQHLNEEQIECPHPKPFVENGLRLKDSWSCSDVEMALFKYASTVLGY
jgi:hypothetical protein